MSLSTKMLSSSASSAQSLIDIPLQELPGEVEQGEFFDVIVVNVRSPSKFFVQLKSQHLKLTALMDILDHTMEAAMKEEHLDSTLLEVPRVGMYVAARWPHDENWYRAVVVGMASNTHVTLFLIDYGDICEVEWKFSRSLLSQFQELPAQAIQAKLLGVKPNSEVSESTYD